MSYFDPSLLSRFLFQYPSVSLHAGSLKNKLCYFTSTFTGYPFRISNYLESTKFLRYTSLDKMLNSKTPIRRYIRKTIGYC